MELVVCDNSIRIRDSRTWSRIAQQGCGNLRIHHIRTVADGVAIDRDIVVSGYRTCSRDRDGSRIARCFDRRILELVADGIVGKSDYVAGTQITYDHCIAGSVETVESDSVSPVQLNETIR